VQLEGQARQAMQQNAFLMKKCDFVPQTVSYIELNGCNLFKIQDFR
jgi:hypothetical protein